MNISPPTLQPKARIGIIGAGNRGINCFGKLLSAHQDVDLVALADSNAMRLQGAVQLLGRDLRLYSGAPAMLRDEELDGAIVTSPDYLHADLAEMCLRAGVPHVLVDKPLATTTAGCLRVMQAARESGGTIAVGFNLRHNTVISKIKEVVDAGMLGDLMLIENREFYDGGRTYMARWNRKYEWSGGLWVHKGSHDFDVFNWWNSGGTPARVSASAGVNALRADKIPFEVKPDVPVGPTCAVCAYNTICPDRVGPIGGPALFSAQTAAVDGYVQDLCIFLSDKDTHDNGIALVEYDNNVRASHLECFVCGFEDRFYTLVGDRGTLTASLSEPSHLTFRPRWGATQLIEVPAPADGGHGGADPLLVDNLVASIRGQSVHSSNWRDGLRAVAVGQAAEIATRERRSVEIKELVDLHDPALNAC